MNISKRIACGISLCIACVLLSGTSCSYVVDTVEGAINKRSAFSADASVSVVSSNYTVTVDWSASPPSIDEAAFAGYEVYITKKVDNEFSGYELVASGYSLGVTEATVDPTLQISSLHSFPVPLQFTPDPGDVYYFRVGVVYWSEEKEADRESKWTSPQWVSKSASGGYYYPLKTKLEKISGGARVEF